MKLINYFLASFSILFKVYENFGFTAENCPQCGCEEKMKATISDFRSCDAFRLRYDELKVADPMKTDYNGIYEILPGEFYHK